MQNYDLICVGAGPAGICAALRAAKKYGKHCAVIDNEEHFGGCCVNEGCVPTKFMCFYTSKMEQFEPISANENESQHKAADLAGIHQSKDAARDIQRHALRRLLTENKIDFIDGKAKILRDEGNCKIIEIAQQVIIAKQQTTRITQVETSNVVISVGSEPTTLPGIQIDNKMILSSTSCMELRKVPESLAIIGAGAIGLEMGSIWKRLGCKQVTLIDIISHIASPVADEQIANEYQSILESEGLKFILQVSVQGIETKKDGTGAIVKIKGKDDQQSRAIHCEKVLMAIGRKPATQHLGIVEMGVKMEKNGAIIVDEFGQSNVPGLFAIGDCSPGPMVAHKSTIEAHRAIEFMFNKDENKKSIHLDFDCLPSVIYTQPELAWVGKSESRLRSEGKQVGVKYVHFVNEMRNTLCPNLTGVAKIVYDNSNSPNEEDHKVLHVSYVSATAGDLIAEAVLAVKLGAPLSSFGFCPHVHPVFKSLNTMLDLEM